MDNATNDNSSAMAPPINLGLPKGIAITPNAEIKMRVINTPRFLIMDLIL